MKCKKQMRFKRGIGIDCEVWNLGSRLQESEDQEQMNVIAVGMDMGGIRVYTRTTGSYTRPRLPATTLAMQR